MEMSKRNSHSPGRADYLNDKIDASEYDSLLGVKRTIIPYPKSVFFILGNEFCERFSYYGMRAVLTLYLRNALQFPDSSATVIFHVFVMLCYFTPLFGAMLADSFLGKFKTILYLSIIYAFGNVTLSMASSPVIPIPTVTFSLIGLALIAIGTGGIKPCVAAFGGDQFTIPGQEKALEQYFFIFYFLVNFGSVISTFLTPIFRKDVQCYGQNTCYPLAFGVPAGLMILSLVIFASGLRLYKVRLPDKNVMVEVVKCISLAISNRNALPKKAHWLDNASDRYDKVFIEDVKILLRVVLLYIPLPVFWALFDQQGSQWTLQATRMNGHVFNGWTIKPDQMQLVNSLLVVILIPVFEMFIYPLLGKCNILRKPLQRMTFGGLLVSLSFVIAAVLELKIESTTQALPGVHESNLNFVNTLPCPLHISLSDVKGQQIGNSSLLPFENSIYRAIPAINYSVSIEPYNQSESCLLNGQPLSLDPGRRLPIPSKSGQSRSILIISNDNLEPILVDTGGEDGDDLEKSQEGNAKIRISFTGLLPGNHSISLESVGYNYELPLNNTETGSASTKEIQPGKYLVRITQVSSNPKNSTSTSSTLLNILTETGGSYLLTLFPDRERNLSSNGTSKSSDIIVGKIFTLTNPDSVSMLLILPQYVVITVGEILFAITGYEFSYSQAPNSMKAVVQSMWLMTTAFGNLIVILVVESGMFTIQSTQFFFFSGLNLAGIIVFIFLGYRYTTIKTPPSSPAGFRKQILPPSYDDDSLMNDTYLGK